jgi:hypothetical protein
VRLENGFGPPRPPQTRPHRGHPQPTSTQRRSLPAVDEWRLNSYPHHTAGPLPRFYPAPLSLAPPLRCSRSAGSQPYFAPTAFRPPPALGRLAQQAARGAPLSSWPLRRATRGCGWPRKWADRGDARGDHRWRFGQAPWPGIRCWRPVLWAFARWRARVSEVVCGVFMGYDWGVRPHSRRRLSHRLHDYAGSTNALQRRQS